MNPPGAHNFAKFSPKLHEIERIWMPGGGGVHPLCPPPLDLPMLVNMDIFQMTLKLSLFTVDF